MDLLKEEVPFRPPLPEKCEHISTLQTTSTADVPDFIEAIQETSDQSIAHDGQYIGFIRLVIVSEQHLIDYKWSRNNKMPVTIAVSPTGSPLLAVAAYRLSSPVTRADTTCSLKQFKLLRPCQKIFITLVFTYPQVDQICRRYKTLQMTPVMRSMLMLYSDVIASLGFQYYPRAINKFGFHESLEANKSIAQSVCYFNACGSLVIADMDEFTLFAVIVGNFASINGIKTGQSVLDTMTENSQDFLPTRSVCYAKADPKYQLLDNKTRIFVHWLLLTAILRDYQHKNFIKHAMEMMRSISLLTKSRPRSFKCDASTYTLLKKARESILYILPKLTEPLFATWLRHESANCRLARLHVGQMLSGFRMTKFDVIDEFLKLPPAEMTKAHIHPEILKDIEVYEVVKAMIWTELSDTKFPFRAYCLFNPHAFNELEGFGLLHFCANVYKNKMHTPGHVVVTAYKSSAIHAELLYLLEQRLEYPTNETNDTITDQPSNDQPNA